MVIDIGPLTFRFRSEISLDSFTGSLILGFSEQFPRGIETRGHDGGIKLRFKIRSFIFLDRGVPQ